MAVGKDLNVNRISTRDFRDLSAMLLKLSHEGIPRWEALIARVRNGKNETEYGK